MTKNSNARAIAMILCFALLFSLSIANFGYTYSLKKTLATREEVNNLVQTSVDKVYTDERLTGAIRSELEIFRSDLERFLRQTLGIGQEVSIDDDPILGKKDAPVTIIEFSDYQCPFCGKFFSETLPQIKEKYIDTGKARLIFRDFPLSFHPDAVPAAIAAECADDEGKYFEMHDKLFQDQQALTKENFLKYAKEIGLNQSKFQDCVDNETYKDEVQKDQQDGSSYGVNGTPGFFINGRILEGAQPFSAFEKVIEDELKKVKK